MNYVKLITVSCVSAFLVLVHICSSNAAETGKYGGILAPNLVSPQGCSTSGPADALFSIINFDSPYVFVVVEQLVPLISIGRAYYQGQNGLSATLIIDTIIGFFSMVNGKVYFFNSEGCPNIMPVENSNATIYGYKNLYGSLAYQAFAAVAAECEFFCNTCPTSELNGDPSQTAFGQGRVAVVMRNIQSASVITPSSLAAPVLKQKLNSRLTQDSVQSYNLRPCAQCVNVVKDNPFLASCPPYTKVLTSQIVRNSILNPSFIQKNQFCSITISQALELQRRSQPTFAIYRYIFPSICGTVSLVSCVSTLQVFEAIAEAFFQFCG